MQREGGEEGSIVTPVCLGGGLWEGDGGRGREREGGREKEKMRKCGKHCLHSMFSQPKILIIKKV